MRPAVYHLPEQVYIHLHLTSMSFGSGSVSQTIGALMSHALAPLTDNLKSRKMVLRVISHWAMVNAKFVFDTINIVSDVAHNG